MRSATNADGSLRKPPRKTHFLLIIITIMAYASAALSSCNPPPFASSVRSIRNRRLA